MITVGFRDEIGPEERAELEAMVADAAAYDEEAGFSTVSLDNYREDADGRFDWSMPDEEVHTFINELFRPTRLHLYGRRNYETMLYWDAEHPEAATTVAMAKLVAPRVASHVVDEALQVFGGYGFIEETPVAMHYRDARILRIGGGTDEVQLEILSKRMGL